MSIASDCSLHHLALINFVSLANVSIAMIESYFFLQLGDFVLLTWIMEVSFVKGKIKLSV